MSGVACLSVRRGTSGRTGGGHHRRGSSCALGYSHRRTGVQHLRGPQRHPVVVCHRVVACGRGTGGRVRGLPRDLHWCVSVASGRCRTHRRPRGHELVRTSAGHPFRTFRRACSVGLPEGLRHRLISDHGRGWTLPNGPAGGRRWGLHGRTRNVPRSVQPPPRTPRSSTGSVLIAWARTGPPLEVSSMPVVTLAPRGGHGHIPPETRFFRRHRLSGLRVEPPSCSLRYRGRAPRAARPGTVCTFVAVGNSGDTHDRKGPPVDGIVPCEELATPPSRVATVSLHTSPLDQPGTGDAGGLNVYVVEVARRMAERNVAVDVFTRATSPDLPPVVELVPGVNVHHVPAGPYGLLDKDILPEYLCPFLFGMLRTEAQGKPNHYDLVHGHYWLSGSAGVVAARRWGVPFVQSMHTMARVKNAALAEGDSAEPEIRVRGEDQLVRQADRLIANTDHEAHQLRMHYGA